MGFSIGIGMGLSNSSLQGSWSLDAFMATQADGFYFDFTKTDRLFQESTGIAPANDPAEPIGLALDFRSWGGKSLSQLLATQPSVMTGSFAPQASFDNVINTQTTTSFTTTGGATAMRVYKDIVPTVAGNFYRLTFRVVSTTHSIVGYARNGLGGAGSTIVNTANVDTGQTGVMYFQASSTTTSVMLVSSSTSGGSMSVDLFEVVAIPGRHTFQSASSNRPALQTGGGAVFDGSDDNLLVDYLPDVTAGSELLVNGDFASGSTGWTVNTGWSVGSGVATASAAAAFTGMGYTYALVTGKTYRVQFDITAVSAGGVRPILLGGTQVSGTARTTVGTFTEYLTCTAGNSSLVIQAVTGGFTGSIDNVSLREVVTSPNFIMMKATIPASLSGTQVLLGTNTGTDRFFVGIDATTGHLRYGIGTVAESTTGGADLRGKTTIIGITFDSNTVRVYEDGAIIREIAQNGVPSRSVPQLRIGAANNGGSAGGFFAGTIMSVAVGREFLTLERFQQIAAKL